MDNKTSGEDLRSVIADEFDTKDVIADLPDETSKSETVAAPEPKEELEAFEKKSKSGTYKPKQKAEKILAKADGMDPAPTHVAPVVGIPAGEANLNPIIPPPNWNAEEKAFFKTLPAKEQSIIARYNREMTRGMNQKFQEMSSVMRRYESLESEVKPYAQDLALMGVPVEKAIGSALAWDKLQRTDPTEFVKQVIALNPGRIDFRAIFGTQGQAMPQGAQPQQFQQSPQSFELPEEFQQEFGQIKDTVNMLKQGITSHQQTALNQLVQQWRDATDENGNPLHPYLEDLGETFRQKALALSKADPSADIGSMLDDAYELALRANPDVRDAINQKRESALKAKQLEESRAKMAKADRAAGIKGSGGGAMAPAKMGTRDTIASMVNEM